MLKLKLHWLVESTSSLRSIFAQLPKLKGPKTAPDFSLRFVTSVKGLETYLLHCSVSSWKPVCVSLQWFEEKLQEVESTDQYFRKLHALVESLVVHRKGAWSTDSGPFLLSGPVLTSSSLQLKIESLLVTLTET